MTIKITPSIHLADDEITETYMHAPGPGGQNVNKVETAVQLRFDAVASLVISPAVLRRLRTLAGRRMTKAGVLIISAHRHRSQIRNRADAMERLIALVRQATIAPKHRQLTKPSRAARQRRLDFKKRRSGIKQNRGRIGDPD